MTTLRDAVRRAYIVAFREEVKDLRACLESSGFETEVVRGPSPREQPNWSRALKCLASHRDVWDRIAASDDLSLVCEADFVPVRALGEMPLPCPPPTDRDDARIAWLYSPGSILYGVDRFGFTYGHANSAVAYLMTPGCAEKASGFLEEETAALGDRTYVVWDSRLGVYLRKRHGILNYFTVAQLGEHGGAANPEHSRHGYRGWHQAYALAGPTAFVPGYAKSSSGRRVAVRLRARARGALRILTRRFFDPRFVDPGQDRVRLGLVALSALLGPRSSERRRLRLAHRAWKWQRQPTEVAKGGEVA